MFRSPRAFLCVDLENQLVRLEQVRIDDRNEWKNIAAMVVDVEHDDASGAWQRRRVNIDRVAARVRHDQIEADRDCL